MGDYISISEAKVAVYEKHKQDLQYLKRLVKENLDKKAYQNIFILTDEKTANYSAYIGMTKKNGKKSQTMGKKCSKEEFYAFLRKEVLAAIPKDSETEYLREE